MLRRTVTADGRSRAFVNDQATGVGVLRELGELLVQVHGQHETAGLLDARTHRPLLDAFGGCAPELSATAQAWSAWRAARERAEALRAAQGRAAEETEELSLRLSELDRLDPREGEEAALAEERAILGAAEKALADIGAARDHLGGEAVTSRLAQAYRALERARERAVAAGASAQGDAARLILLAAEAVDRALIEATEASAAVDAAAQAFDVEPDRLEKAEERLFALRAMGRKLGVAVEELPTLRAQFAARLLAIETSGEALARAERAETAARAAYQSAAAGPERRPPRRRRPSRQGGWGRTGAAQAGQGPLPGRAGAAAGRPRRSLRRRQGGVRDRHPAGRALRGPGRHRLGRRAGALRPGAEGLPGRPRRRPAAADDLRRGRSGRWRRRRRRRRPAPQEARC